MAHRPVDQESVHVLEFIGDEDSLLFWKGSLKLGPYSKLFIYQLWLTFYIFMTLLINVAVSEKGRKYKQPWNKCQEQYALNGIK